MRPGSDRQILRHDQRAAGYQRSYSLGQLGERLQPLLQGLDSADVDRLLDALIEHQSGAGDIWDKLLISQHQAFHGRLDV